MDSIKKLVACRTHNPFETLGWQKNNEKWTLRVFRPEVKSVSVISNREKSFNMADKGAGIFEAVFNDKFPYKLFILYENGEKETLEDPYSFEESFFTEYDIYLFNEGTHLGIHKKLGAQKRTVDRVLGYNFSVWAPNAKGVSVVGDFNFWDGRIHQMKSLESSGIWEIFIPGINDNERYKFEIRTEKNSFLKSDPYGNFFEMRPANTSITHCLDYKWENPALFQESICDAPMSIYEMHMGSWKKQKGRFLNYRDIAKKLVPYLKETGFNWVEFLPVSEHPLDSSWGYQATGFFAPTSRHGTPEDFCFLIDALHENGIGVILDWTAAHFPKDSFGLYNFDGTCLYEHSDPKKGDHPDWKSAIFNYGRCEVINFLIGSALNWLEKYRIDALRVDGVASMLYLDYSRKPGEWIPNVYGGNENLEAVNFLQKFNTWIYKNFPCSFTVAEESTSWPMVSRPVNLGGLGFGFKWNMGWMHDTLQYFSADPVHRKYHHNHITFSMLYAFAENFILPVSHDEVVYGKKSLLAKMPGDMWQKRANLRLMLTYMYCFPGKKLLFMGCEFAQINEWDHNGELDWHLLENQEHSSIKSFIKDLNCLYLKEKSLFEKDFQEDGFQWIDFSDFEQSVVSFIRKGRSKKDFLICIFNFTPVPRFNYRIGVPERIAYREMINSDSQFYGGSNIGNLAEVSPEDKPSHGLNYSLSITIPPLAAVILKPSRK